MNLGRILFKSTMTSALIASLVAYKPLEINPATINFTTASIEEVIDLNKTAKVIGDSLDITPYFDSIDSIIHLIEHLAPNQTIETSYATEQQNVLLKKDWAKNGKLDKYDFILNRTPRKKLHQKNFTHKQLLEVQSYVQEMLTPKTIKRIKEQVKKILEIPNKITNSKEYKIARESFMNKVEEKNTYDGTLPKKTRLLKRATNKIIEAPIDFISIYQTSKILQPNKKERGELLALSTLLYLSENSTWGEVSSERRYNPFQVGDGAKNDTIRHLKLNEKYNALLFSILSNQEMFGENYWKTNPLGNEIGVGYAYLSDLRVDKNLKGYNRFAIVGCVYHAGIGNYNRVTQNINVTNETFPFIFPLIIQKLNEREPVVSKRYLKEIALRL